MLTLEIVPYKEIESLSSIGKIRKLLNIARENKIVLLEGRLKREEEAELIKTTMEEIDDDFKGIEMAVIQPDVGDDANVLNKIRSNMANMLLGNRTGLTVIGPASVVKAVKKDPTKIQLLTQNNKKGKKRKKARKKSRRR